MKIIKAKNIGFCKGVERAFLMVEKRFSNQKTKGSVFILGSLAHNRGVEKKVDEMGIKKISNFKKVKKGDLVIITAHGAPKEIYEKIKSKGAKVFDTTCVNVKRVQALAKKYQRKGWKVIIFGDSEHKEVKGILGHCKNKAEVINSVSEASRLIAKLKKKPKAFVLISQTTKNIKIFEEISSKFKKLAVDIEIEADIFDTICRASHVRQEETEKLAKRCDLSVIIGGKESANTKRLWQIAKKVNESVFWIKEVKKNLPISLKKKMKQVDRNGKICIISGASTPFWEIDQVEKNLKRLTL